MLVLCYSSDFPYSGRTCDGESLLRRARAPLFSTFSNPAPPKEVLEFPILVRANVVTRLALGVMAIHPYSSEKPT